MMEITSEVYFAAGDIMASKGKRHGIADEGGWWPEFSSNEDALETLTKAMKRQVKHLAKMWLSRWILRPLNLETATDITSRLKIEK